MRRSAVSLLCFLLILAGLSAPAAAKRVALVIGNDSYENVADLQKAVNDAKAVGAALESIGFEVLRAENVSRREMNSQIQSFASKLESGDEALFFFAGHGVGIEGRNFLLPVDAPNAAPGQEDFVEAEAVSAERVLDTIRRRGARVAILVLDACRDNPFQREGTRSLGGSRGLARMDAGRGTFIIYSADIGQTALDRLSNSDSDPNSVFTRSLIPMLKRPGLPLPQMARAVRAEVEKLALGISHDQRPAYYDGITGDFFFAGEADLEKSEEAPTPVAAPPPPADNAVEVAFWNSVQSSDSTEAIQAYLSRFPGGAFAGLAKLRLEALEQKQAALPPAQEVVQKVEGAAEPRDADAMFEMALKYDDGRSGAKDDGEAVRWYRKAADLGHAAAMNGLGAMYENGRGVAEDDGEGIRWWRKAADLGNTDAMTNLSENTQDHGEAVRWYRKAADLGDIDAMMGLGMMYLMGSRVAKDDGEALRWFRKAAELGDASAMFNLGVMYRDGRGVARDDGEAVRWWRKAADLGNPLAIWELAGQ